MDFVELDQNKQISENNTTGIDFDSEWDDIQLTPVNSASDDSKNPEDASCESEKEVSSDFLDAIKQQISSGFKELEESFMYLGVLKKLALPEARGFFESKFDGILSLFHQIWENQAFPEKDHLFNAIGEDYEKLKQTHPFRRRH